MYVRDAQRTLDAVREAQGAGVEPWNKAEHDKAVHNPAATIHRGSGGGSRTIAAIR